MLKSDLFRACATDERKFRNWSLEQVKKTSICLSTKNKYLKSNSSKVKCWSRWKKWKKESQMPEMKFAYSRAVAKLMISGGFHRVTQDQLRHQGYLLTKLWALTKQHVVQDWRYSHGSLMMFSLQQVQLINGWIPFRKKNFFLKRCLKVIMSARARKKQKILTKVLGVR